MRRYTEQKTVGNLCRRLLNNTINLQPTYQRGAVWSKKQKQLLIDSILNNLDIPKLYLNDISGDSSNSFNEEAIDGQQRLTAISEFYQNKFSLGKITNDINDFPVKGKRYKDLNESIKDDFDNYNLTVVILADATEIEVEEMFLRLQNGTTLNPAEKRNAMPGNMTEFIRDLAKHKFFTKCLFKNHRFTYHNIAAQMARIALSDNPRVDLGNPELVKLYESNQDFNKNGKTAHNILSALEFLDLAFENKTPELTKLTAITLFSIALHFKLSFVTQNLSKDFRRVFLDFEAELRSQKGKPINERIDYLNSYEDACAKSTTSHISVSKRYSTILYFYLENLPSLRRLDNQRNFTEEQRTTIWRRDNAICQVKIKCDGKAACGWDDWHADHVVPWSKGGQTSVENGQVACSDCNLAKGSN